MSYQPGDKVEWEWGNGTTSGEVENQHKEKGTRSINRSEVTRNGSDDDPALEIKHDDDTKVLKFASERREA